MHQQIFDAVAEVTSSPETKSKLEHILLEMAAYAVPKRQPAILKSGKGQKSSKAAQAESDLSPIERRGCVFAILDKHIMALPLECMPVIKDQPVCRIPTIAQLQDVWDLFFE